MSKKRIKELQELIKYYDIQYYGMNKSIISDNEYDKLKSEYKKISNEDFIGYEGDFFLSSDETSLEEKKSGFEKISHITPVLSLNNVYSFEEFEEFIKRVKKYTNLSEKIEFLCEHKIDGLTIVLQYQNGKIISASTRGDGSIGDNVLKNLNNVIPKELLIKNDHFNDFWKNHDTDSMGKIEIRGEIFITKENFKFINNELNSISEEVFSTSRHAASGILRSINSKNLKYFDKLSFLAHGFAPNQEIFDLYKYYLNFKKRGIFNEISSSDIKDMLMNLGIDFVEGKVFKDTDQMKNFYDEINTKRNEILYDIDGVVYKINNIELQKIIGNSNSYPKFAVAYKFDSKKAKTIIEDIIFQVGRSGIITPVAKLTPVYLDGVTVSRVTLHNFSEIENMNLGIGDSVLIERSGDVVPHIYQVIKKFSLNKVSTPTQCPCCKNELIKKNILIYCLNKNCKERNILQIMHFVSRNAINIAGLGRKNIEFLYDMNFIKNSNDIYELKNFQKELEKQNNWGIISVKNLLNQIELSKNITFDKFLYGLGINGIGEFSAKSLALQYENLEKILSDIGYDFVQENFTKSDKKIFTKINGIGELTSIDIFDFFYENIDYIIKLYSNFNIKKIITDIKIPFIYNKKFSITGKFQTKSRKDIQNIIENNEGIFFTTVNSNIDFLIFGENPGSKLKKANELGVQTLSENEFFNKI